MNKRKKMKTSQTPTTVNILMYLSLPPLLLVCHEHLCILLKIHVMVTLFQYDLSFMQTELRWLDLPFLQNRLFMQKSQIQVIFCILSGKTKLSSEPQKTFETKFLSQGQVHNFLKGHFKERRSFYGKYFFILYVRTLQGTSDRYSDQN